MRWQREGLVHLLEDLAGLVPDLAEALRLQRHPHTPQVSARACHAGRHQGGRRRSGRLGTLPDVVVVVVVAAVSTVSAAAVAATVSATAIAAATITVTTADAAATVGLADAAALCAAALTQFATEAASVAAATRPTLAATAARAIGLWHDSLQLVFRQISRLV